MLRVRAIKKYRDTKGNLIGYLIQEVGTTNQMQVQKDALKDAVKRGVCEIVNMTLTSDGRLIGHAAKEPVKRVRAVEQSLAYVLCQVFTSGGKPVMGLAIGSNSDAVARILGSMDVKKAVGEIKKLESKDIDFVLRDELQEKIKAGVYRNIPVSSGAKVSLAQCGVVNKKFETQLKSLTDLIDKSGGITALDVVAVDKTTYTVKISANASNRKVAKAAIAIVCNAIMEEKIKVEGYSEADMTVTAKCLTGVKDLRKALKAVSVRKSA